MEKDITNKINELLYDKEDLAQYLVSNRIFYIRCKSSLKNNSNYFVAEREPKYSSGSYSYVKKDLDEYISKEFKKERNFQNKLKEYLRIKNLKDTDVYKSVFMPEKNFNRIKNQDPDASISKNIAILICFGLRLTEAEMTEMLALAGKTLRNNCERDLIIKYFFNRKIYDIHALNAALYDNKKQPLNVIKDDA